MWRELFLMRYENVIIFRPELSEDQLNKILDTLTQHAEKEGGRWRSREYCGLRPLAYPIKKNSRGHYVVSHIELPPHALKELKRIMSLEENIIRMLFVKVDEFEKENSALFLAKENRYSDTRRPSRGRFPPSGAPRSERFMGTGGRRFETQTNNTKGASETTPPSTPS